MNKLFRCPEILFYYLSTEYMTVLPTIFLGPDACFIGIIENANLLHVSMLINVQWNKMWNYQRFLL